MQSIELSDVLDDRIDHDYRGFSPRLYGRRLRDVVGASLFDGSFSPPVMVLKRTALDHNIATMASWCRAHGVELAPHGKTPLAPQLFERQLAAGAWGISVATPAQVHLCRSAGIRRVVLANELVDPEAIAATIADLRDHPEHDFLCYVDSVEGVRLLDEGLRGAAMGRPFDVLLEVGVIGGRTGCRSVEAARSVAQAVAAVDGLRIVGVAGYEGGIGQERSAAGLAGIRDYVRFMLDTAGQLVGEGLIHDRGGGIILSAGGSLYFDEVAQGFAVGLPGGQASVTILRSGAYISHDDGLYERLSPLGKALAGTGDTLRAAFEAWGHVLSVPEPGLAIASVGRRDVPSDQDLPVPLRLRRSRSGAMVDVRACSVKGLNDQHAFVEVAPEIEIEAGDWLSFGISHPCTTFDKWRLIPEVDDDDRVVGFIRTFF